jgi:hypothetical protein
MNKKTTLAIATSTVILIGSIFLFRLESDKKDISNSVLHENAPYSNEQGKKANIIETVGKVTDKPESILVKATEAVENSFDYEDDWCSVYSDLNSTDKNFAYEALEDDAAAKGNIIIGKYGDREINLGQTELIKPYMESSLEDLYFYIENDNPHAIIAALNREDIPLKKQTSIAKKALIFDLTGEPLNLLVILHMVEAERLYKKNGKIFSNDAKNQVKMALAYAFYGLNRFSINGLQQLASDATQNKSEEYIMFDPSKSFTEDDINDSLNIVSRIKEDVNSHRRDKLLQPLSKDVSKITKHRFERDLGLLYSLQPEFTKRYSKMFSSYIPNLEKTSCVSKYAQQLSGKN